MRFVVRKCCGLLLLTLAQSASGSAGPPTDEASPRHIVRQALGTKQGGVGFRADADLNLDGVVNVIDAAYSRLGNPPSAPTSEVKAAKSAEVILVDPALSPIAPGGTASILFLIRSNTTPVLGYSLDIQIVPAGNTLGTVSADASMTNFYDARNLITAGGATRDPFFSVIQANGTGIFINTITDDNSTVLATDGVNDVLVEVVFHTSADACGTFQLELGPASALSDGTAAPIAFDFSPAALVVNAGSPCTIPATSQWGLLVLVLLIMTCGTHVFRRTLQFERQRVQTVGERPQ